jgi:hypothetical protein
MAVALGEYVRELERRLEVTRRRHPMAEWPTALEITATQEMIAGSAGASSSLRPMWRADQLPQRILAGRKQRHTAPGRNSLGCLGDSGAPTLAANPDAADLRVGRVQAPKPRGERAV